MTGTSGQRASRSSLRGPVAERRVPPAEAADEVRLSDLLAIGLERAEDVFPCVELKVSAACERGPDEGMNVPFDKAGKQHFAGEIHDVRLRPDERFNPRFIADEQDALALDRHRADPGIAAINRVDRPVLENDVRVRICCGAGLGAEGGPSGGARRSTSGEDGPSANRLRPRQTAPALRRRTCVEIPETRPVASDAHDDCSFRHRRRSKRQLRGDGPQ